MFVSAFEKKTIYNYVKKSNVSFKENKKISSSFSVLFVSKRLDHTITKTETKKPTIYIKIGKQIFTFV